MCGCFVDYGKPGKPKAGVLGFQRNGIFFFSRWNQSFLFKINIIMGDCDLSFARNCVLSDRETPIEAEIIELGAA